MAKKDKQYHRRSDGAVVEPNQQREYCFHWQTELTSDRMETISAWLSTLTDEQKSYIKDLTNDAREQGAYDESRNCDC